MQTPSDTRIRALAERFHVLVESDGNGFRRRARLLQSMWREAKGIPAGTIHAKGHTKLLGSRIPMPLAENDLLNYLTDNIRSVVRSTLSEAAPDQVFSKPRIFNDLLSSQPMCFNLFGELCQDLALATRVFAILAPQRIGQVASLKFEYSPGRGQQRYTADGTAFDVYCEFTTPSGGAGFIGIEMKYHENLKGKAAQHRPRYDEIAKIMNCFRVEAMPDLRKQPLQQIWRDHLLAGVTRIQDRFDDGFYVFVYPQDNKFCSEAIQKYLTCLDVGCDSVQVWTLEQLIDAIIAASNEAAWSLDLKQRYLGWERLNVA